MTFDVCFCAVYAPYRRSLCCFALCTRDSSKHIASTNLSHYTLKHCCVVEDAIILWTINSPHFIINFRDQRLI